MEAIVLAGGKGTRLRSVVSDLPKPMAGIGDKPFLYYQLKFLKSQGISSFILAVGYKYEAIKSFFGDNFEGIPITYSIEETALGTGGGVKYALHKCKTNEVLVCNGDTFFDFNLHKLKYAHYHFKSSFTFSVHKVYNTGRYGGMEILENAQVASFIAKDVLGDTYINAGAYLIDKELFLLNTDNRSIFSLEDDYLATRVRKERFYAVPFTGAHFLDIGIPEDYKKAQILIPEWTGEKSKTIHTIFLDRDGVINKKVDHDYVRNVNQLEVLPGVIDWLASHNDKLLLVVTNQRGVGRGLMSSEDVNEIHKTINEYLGQKDTRISKFYVCEAIDEQDPRRKPHTGMLEEALGDFPAIAKESAVLIGDSKSDLEAAARFGISSVYISKGIGFDFATMELASSLATSLSEVELESSMIQRGRDTY